MYRTQNLNLKLVCFKFWMLCGLVIIMIGAFN
ncbi:hypothetical protein NC652_003921 [Populus alba x Populus x berolinensis]|nr:hypothetical protein NC652_003921 [Populus alba x Populus x berolinensis]